MTKLLKSWALVGLFAGLAFFPQHSRAAVEKGEGTMGLGAIFGEPTGISGKYWLGNRYEPRAIDAGLAYDFNNFFLIYADHLWHFPTLFKGTSLFETRLSPYLGVGGILFISTASNRTDNRYYTSNGTVGFGARVPLGIEWLPSHPPIGIFAELVPGLGIVPGIFAFLEGGVGIRYYFQP